MGAICTTLCIKGCCEPCCSCCLSKKTPGRMTSMLQSRPEAKGGLPQDCKVTAVSLSLFAVGEGLLSTLYRVQCEFGPKSSGDGGASTVPGPTSYVVKVSPTETKARALGEVLDLFDTEVRFYTSNLPERSGLHPPRCHYAGKASGGRFCIVLEDLAPAKVGDQRTGLSIEQARAGTIALARFHARFRGATRTDPDLAGEWLRKQDDRKYYALVKKAYAKAAKAVTIPDVEGGPEIKEFGLEFVRYFDGWLESAIQSPIPMTLMHGDARGENFFFDAPLTGPVEGQAGSGDTVLRVIDYQLLKEGPGPAELSYFLMSSLTVEDRRRHELELLKLYHSTQLAEGVTDYPMVDLLTEYQFSLAGAVAVLVLQCNDASIESEAAQELARLSTIRTWAQLDDHKYFDCARAVYSDGRTLDAEGRRLTVDELARVMPERYVQLARQVDQ